MWCGFHFSDDTLTAVPKRCLGRTASHRGKSAPLSTGWPPRATCWRRSEMTKEQRQLSDHDTREPPRIPRARRWPDRDLRLARAGVTVKSQWKNVPTGLRGRQCHRGRRWLSTGEQWATGSSGGGPPASAWRAETGTKVPDPDVDQSARVRRHRAWHAAWAADQRRRGKRASRN